jgi:CcmD family protein
MSPIKRLIVMLAAVLVLAAPAFAQQPAPRTPPASQDGFVPVDAPINPSDTIPAPRLVAIAYGFIWIVLFGYLWSVRTRLARVEREIQNVGQSAGRGGAAGR